MEAQLFFMWFVVQHKPSQGDRALLNLTNQGVSCFYPKVQVQHCRQGKVLWRPEPLFPGYIFIELAEDDVAWSKIRSTRGVQKIIGFSGRPAEVSREVIAQVRETLGFLGDQPKIKPGQKVRVIEGPFTGLDAVFQAFDGEHRAMVLVSFMQKMCSVALPLSAVKP